MNKNKDYLEMYSFLKEKGVPTLSNVLVNKEDYEDDVHYIECYAELGKTGRYVASIRKSKSELISKDYVNQNRKTFDALTILFKGILSFSGPDFYIIKEKYKLLTKLDDGSEVKMPIVIKSYRPDVAILDDEPYLIHKASNAMAFSVKDDVSICNFTSSTKTNAEMTTGKYHYWRIGSICPINDVTAAIPKALQYSEKEKFASAADLMHDIYICLLSQCYIKAYNAQGDEDKVNKAISHIKEAHEEFREELITVTAGANTLKELVSTLSTLKNLLIDSEEFNKMLNDKNNAVVKTIFPIWTIMK